CGAVRPGLRWYGAIQLRLGAGQPVGTAGAVANRILGIPLLRKPDPLVLRGRSSESRRPDATPAADARCNRGCTGVVPCSLQHVFLPLVDLAVVCRGARDQSGDDRGHAAGMAASATAGVGLAG